MAHEYWIGSKEQSDNIPNGGGGITTAIIFVFLVIIAVVSAAWIASLVFPSSDIPSVNNTDISELSNPNITHPQVYNNPIPGHEVLYQHPVFFFISPAGVYTVRVAPVRSSIDDQLHTIYGGNTTANLTEDFARWGNTSDDGSISLMMLDSVEYNITIQNETNRYSLVLLPVDDAYVVKL
jgi:hypothetical protein